MRADRVVLVVVMLVLAASTAGCAMKPVKAWERGRLARWDMRLDPDALDARMRDHEHFSKEAIAGRLKAAGGGCGCN